jgi:hypothetical protein
MKLRWRQIVLGGIVLAVPVVVKIVRSVPEREVHLFNQYIGKSCAKCHRTFNKGLWWAFTRHIMDDHGVEPRKAYDLMAKLSAAYNNLKEGIDGAEKQQGS